MSSLLLCRVVLGKMTESSWNAVDSGSTASSPHMLCYQSYQQPGSSEHWAVFGRLVWHTKVPGSPVANKSDACLWISMLKEYHFERVSPSLFTQRWVCNYPLGPTISVRGTHWSIQKVLCKCALDRAVYTPWWEVRWVATFRLRCMSDGIKMAWGSSRAGYFRQSVMSPKTKILSESRTMVAYTQVWILLCVFHFLYIFIILSKQFYHSLCTFSAFSRVVLGIERNEPHFNPFSWLC